jgi:hypothetical protein
VFGSFIAKADAQIFMVEPIKALHCPAPQEPLVPDGNSAFDEPRVESELSTHRK